MRFSASGGRVGRNHHGERTWYRRIGILAAGLGIGVAIAATPGIASADPVAFDPNDIAISFDGYSLFHEGSATADSGAVGDFNFAFADGTGADAVARGGNYDTAIDIGNNNDINDGAYAGFNSVVIGGHGNNDLVFVLGNNSFAGAGGNDYLGDNSPGDNDIAAVFDPNDTFGSDAYAGSGLSAPADFDIATAYGDDLFPQATEGNYLVDILPEVAGLDSSLSTLLADIGSLF
jgi:hypothetical protein